MRIFLLGERENECHREQKRKRKLVKFEDGDGGVESDRAISVDLTSCCWRALGKRACFIHGGRPTAINEKSIFLRWLTIRIPNNQTRLGFIGMLYTTAYNVANFLHKMRSNLFPVRNVDWRGRQRRRREPGLRGVCAPDDLQEQRRQQLIQGVRACGHHFPFRDTPSSLRHPLGRGRLHRPSSFSWARASGRERWPTPKVCCWTRST